MKEFWAKLTSYSKSAFVTLIIGVAVSITLFALSFCNLLSIFIPIGIILGTLLISISYFLLDKIGEMSNENAKLKYSMIVSVVRLFLLVGLTVLEALLQLKLELELFNPFGFIGAYLFGSTVSIIFMAVEKKKCS